MTGLQRLAGLRNRIDRFAHASLHLRPSPKRRRPQTTAARVTVRFRRGCVRSVGRRRGPVPHPAVRLEKIKPRASCGRGRGGREAPCGRRRSPCGRGNRDDGRGQGGWAGKCASCQSSKNSMAPKDRTKRAARDGRPFTDGRRYWRPARESRTSAPGSPRFRPVRGRD